MHEAQEDKKSQFAEADVKENVFEGSEEILMCFYGDNTCK